MTIPFDTEIVQALHGIAVQFGLLTWVVVLAATYLPYILGVAALVVIFRERPWRKAIWLFLAVGLTAILSRGLITSLLHQFVERARPFVALGFDPLVTVSASERLASFPSGHAAFFFAIAFVLFYSNRRTGWWFVGFSVLNGLARVAAGVHYPSDVLGGIIIALASAYAVHLLIRRFAPKIVVSMKQPPAEPAAPALPEKSEGEPPPGVPAGI